MVSCRISPSMRAMSSISLPRELYLPSRYRQHHQHKETHKTQNTTNQLGYHSPTYSSPDTSFPMTTQQSAIPQRETTGVKVGHVTIGGHAPVVVQSMTNTDTADVTATVQQVFELARAGSELVRITVNTEEAARAVAPIREALDRRGCNVPLIGDFHFNGHKLLTLYPECAEALAKYRINPGNVGRGKKRDVQYATMIEMACRYNKAVRIGVNWGSMDQELVVRMMDEN